MSESVSESTSESIIESISESISESVSESISESICESISESCRQSVSESISESTKESKNESISESISGSFSDSTNEAINESINEATLAPTWPQSHPFGTKITDLASYRHPDSPTKPKASKLCGYIASRLGAKWPLRLVASPRARPKVCIGASSTRLRCFPPDPKETLKCVKTVELSSSSLFWPFQGRVLAPCGPQGSPKVPNVTPLTPQSHPKPHGRHSDPLGCPWSHPGSPRAPNLTHLVAKCRLVGT